MYTVNINGTQYPCPDLPTLGTWLQQGRINASTDVYDSAAQQWTKAGALLGSAVVPPPSPAPVAVQQAALQPAVVANAAHVAVKPVGQIRNPGITILLMIVTCGIYGLIWHYKTFEELKNWRGQGWSGGLYLVFALLLPFMNLAIPWLLPAYIGRMYAEDGKAKPITGNSGWWVLLPLAGGIIWLVIVQNRLNEFWASKGAVA